MVAGKSTQAELLAEYLKKEGKDVVQTREHTRDLSAGKLIDQIVNQSRATGASSHANALCGRSD